MKKSIFFSVFILSILVLYAGKRKNNADNLPLLHTKWILTEVFDNVVLHNPDTAYIIFSDTYKFSGNLGCNLFFGEFSFSKKMIKMDYVGATKKLCFNMEVEDQFMKAIRNDNFHYYIEKNTLYLLDKKNTVCKFEGIVLPQ